MLLDSTDTQSFPQTNHNTIFAGGVHPPRVQHPRDPPARLRHPVGHARVDRLRQRPGTLALPSPLLHPIIQHNQPPTHPIPPIDHPSRPPPNLTHNSTHHITPLTHLIIPHPFKKEKEKPNPPMKKTPPHPHTPTKGGPAEVAAAAGLRRGRGRGGAPRRRGGLHGQAPVSFFVLKVL